MTYKMEQGFLPDRQFETTQTFLEDFKIYIGMATILRGLITAIVSTSKSSSYCNSDSNFPS
jgi:hypothetical protein